MRIVLAAALVALSASSVFAAETFKYYSGADAAALVANGKGAEPAVSFLAKHDDGFLEEIVQRTASGEVEIHDQTSDYIIVLDGAASFTVGGTVAGKKQVSPGEWRAPSSSGGKEYALAPGALVIVPAGTPHWMQLPAGGHIRYVTFKKRG